MGKMEKPYGTYRTRVSGLGLYIYIIYIYIYCGLLPVSPIPLCRWSERHLRPGIHWSQPSKLGHMDPFHAVDGYEIRETTGAGCHGDGSRLSAISLLKMVMDGYGPQLSDDLAGYIGWRVVNGLICLKPAIRSSKMTKLKLWILTFLEYTHVIPCSTLVSKDGRAITHLSALCYNCMIWCCIDSHCHVRSYMIIWTNGFRCMLFCMPQRMITLGACRLTDPTSIQQSKDCDRQSCRCCCCCVLLLAISALWVKIDIEQPMVGNHLYHAGFLWAWKSGIPGLPGYP